MKMNSTIKKTALAIIIIGLFSIDVVAQGQSQSQGKAEATITLSYYKKADLSKTAIAVIKTKNKDAGQSPHFADVHPLGVCLLTLHRAGSTISHTGV